MIISCGPTDDYMIENLPVPIIKRIDMSIS